MEKDILDFPGYKVTDDGKIISYKYKEPRVMKTWFQKSGYENIKLCKDGVSIHCLIHRLVAKAYIPNPNNLPEVNHKNKNRSDNRVENLEWCNRINNLTDSYSTMSAVRNFCNCVLIDKNTNSIVGEFVSIAEASRYASENLGCSYASINKYRENKNYKIVKIEKCND